MQIKPVTCKKCGESFFIYVIDGKPITVHRCPSCAEKYIEE